MKKILGALGLLTLAGVAWAASSFTTHYHLEKPADGDANWGNSYRSNMNEIDEQMFINMSGITSHVASVTAHTAAHISALPGVFCTASTNVQDFLDCLDALADNVVTISGTQTITGNKNFTGNNQFSALNEISGTFQLDLGGLFKLPLDPLWEVRSRVVVTDSEGSITASVISVEELNYLQGATANIQTQINDITSGPGPTPFVLKAGDAMTGSLSIQGVTLAVQGGGVNTAFNINVPGSVTGGVRMNLGNAIAYFATPGRTTVGSVSHGSILVTQSSDPGDAPYVIASATTADELAELSGRGQYLQYLDGLTGNVQAQLNNAGTSLAGVTTCGDANCTIGSSSRFVRTNVALTTTRTYTLPSCVTGNIGEVHYIKKSVASGSDLSLALQVGDTLDGASGPFTITGQDSKSVYCAAATKWENF